MSFERFEILSAVLLSPLLNGIHVSEEQQDLSGDALRPLREQQVVAGDTQRAPAGGVQRLSEDDVLHVGRLYVLRKLHPRLSGKNSKKLEMTSLTLWRKRKRDPRALSLPGATTDALFLWADEESVNSPLFQHIVGLKLACALVFYTGAWPLSGSGS